MPMLMQNTIEIICENLSHLRYLRVKKRRISHSPKLSLDLARLTMI